MSKRGGLGRNLDALIPASKIEAATSTVNRPEYLEAGSRVLVIPISSIRANRQQPRRTFDPVALKELSDSIREVGLLQPPVVREIGGGNYELIMGERRFRASQAAGLREIPVIVRNTSDREMLREALIENIHRSELNALEEAAAYNQLLQDLGVTHDDLAAKIGKSRAAISNTIRLLHLPPAVQRKVVEGLISPGHARALLGLTDASEMEALAQRIVNENLSVRAVEEIVSLSTGKKSAQAKKGKVASQVEFQELAEKLEDHLNTRVKIEKRKIIIEYGDGQDLQRIVRLIHT